MRRWAAETGLILILLLGGCRQPPSEKLLRLDQMPEAARKATERLWAGLEPEAVAVRQSADGMLHLHFQKEGIDYRVGVDSGGTVTEIAEMVAYLPIGEDPGNDRLAVAASATEDLVDAILNSDGNAAGKNLQNVRRLADAAGSDLSETVAESIHLQLDSISSALASDDLAAAGLDGVAVYRSLVESLDSSSLEVPVEVSLLDYSGFKMSVQSLSGKPDWEGIDKSRKEAEEFWRSLAGQVHSKGLSDLVDSIFHDLDLSVKQRNAEQLKSSATLLLDVVDLLEGYFQVAYKTSPSARLIDNYPVEIHTR